MTVETLAKALFLYRTSSNVPLPDDYWERQSASMRGPFIDEAQAVLVALEDEDRMCRCGHDEYEHPQPCSASDCGCMAFGESD